MQAGNDGLPRSVQGEMSASGTSLMTGRDQQRARSGPVPIMGVA